MSFPRLEPKQKARLVTDLLACLDGKSTSQQDTYVYYITTGFLQNKPGRAPPVCDN